MFVNQTTKSTTRLIRRLTKTKSDVTTFALYRIQAMLCRPTTPPKINPSYGLANYYLLSFSYNNLRCGTTTGQVGLPIQRWAFQHETSERVIALKSAPVYAQRLHTY